MTALAIKAVDLHYGAAQALRSVSLDCKPGRITAVLGRNGVGKSSTLRAITGISSISAGEIVFGAEVLRRMPPYRRARMGIGYVPQGREIFPLLTVKENLETGYAGLPRSERDVPDYVFTLFPVLKSMLGRRGGDLSGGQQQQLALWSPDPGFWCSMSPPKVSSPRSSRISAAPSGFCVTRKA
jgi:urea transport system ATP-binding protein